MTAQRTGKLHKKWKNVQTRKRISILLILFRIFLKQLSGKTPIFTVNIMKNEQNFHDYLLYLGVLLAVFLIEETNRKETNCKCRRIVSVRCRRI